VLPRYGVGDYAQLADALLRERKSYFFHEDLRQSCTWENTEAVLRQVHGLNIS
jgi:hypothetical protein